MEGQGSGGRLNHQNSREFGVSCKEHFWPLHGCATSSVGSSLKGCLAPRAAKCCCSEHSCIVVSLNLFLIRLNNGSCVCLIPNSDRKEARR